MWVGLLTDRINNKLERSNWTNEHALNREPVLLKSLSIFTVNSSKKDTFGSGTKFPSKSEVHLIGSKER